MRYFSLFTGVGGFEIGIERAYVEAAHRNKNGRSQGDSQGVSEDGSRLLSEERKSGCDADGRHDEHAHGQSGSRAVDCVGFSEIDKHASAVLRYRFPNVKNYGDISKIDWSGVPDFDLLVGGSPCQDLSIAGKRVGLGGKRSGLFSEYVRALEEKKPSYLIWENVKGALSSNGGRDFSNILSAFSEAGYSLWWQVLNAKDFGVPQNRERIFVFGTREGHPREVFFEREGQGDSTEANKENAGFRVPPITGQGGMNVRGAFVAATPKAGADDGFVNGRIRRLTPRECERLMSWPDDWTEFGAYDNGHVCAPISDTQRYKMCGNGVVSAVVAEVVKAHLL